MKNLKFDDGYQSFTINGDKSRVIRFNPGDVNIVQRSHEALKNIKEASKSLKDIHLNPDGSAEIDGSDEELAAAAETLKQVDNVIRENVNLMFNGDVYDTVFHGQSPFCIVGKGVYLFEAFIDSAVGFVEEAAKEVAEASKERMGKYTAGYTK